MEIIIQDTYKLYKEMMEIANDEREEFYNNKLIKPFEEFFNIMNMPRNPEALGFVALKGKDNEIKDMLDKLHKNDAWNEAKKTLELAEESFKKDGVIVPDKILVGIFLGDKDVLAQSGGYSGMGSIPGYIEIVIAPNEFNLPKLNACIAHEFHHNVLFYNAKWNFMDVTLGKYLAVEGLAESFAGELFGEEFIGPWVTEVQGEDLEKTRKIIGKSLDVKGFMEARKYIFGDHPMMPSVESVGIPYCGGYAVGYYAVQAYIKKKDVSVPEATKVDGDEIMKLSGYFN